MVTTAYPGPHGPPGHVRVLALCGLLLATACSLDVPPPTLPVLPSGPAGFVAGLPIGWAVVGNGRDVFDTGTDTGRTAQSGLSVSVRSVPGARLDGRAFGFGQAVSAQEYAGRRLRLSGWVRTRNVGARGARLWMRVDTPEQAAAFDNMETRPIVTAEWRQFAVVLNVAPDALGFTFGGILADTGQAWWSDLRLEVVGPDVATTGGPAPGRYTATESATMRSMYANALPAPVNLELSARELVTSLPAIAWLRREAIPFQSAEPTGVVTDLAFLRGMVGDARLVGLGEATHGTREHFQMKHRILQYLVRELGFTALAMEASWPEANDIDLYVRTGRGDPAVLLSNLYFWTWNTQEVLDMIRWMREYNATMPPARQVRFLGFDMQFPGTAMDTVTAFVRRVDPALAPAVDSAYACLAPYRNRRQTAGPLRYDRADAAVRATCRAAVTRVHADLVAAAPRHLARVSAEEQARAVQSARLVVQWEDMAADGGTGTARDRYMAENVAWLRAQLPAGTRMALWAHNQHLANVRDAQGSYLRTWYGADYRIIGFTFGTGAFNARPITDGVLGTPRALTTTRVIGGSFEAHAEATTLPRFAVDVRRVTGATDAAALTRAPMRNVGAAFDTRRPELYFGTVRLPEQYDVLIHFRTSTPTRLLPFRFE